MFIKIKKLHRNVAQAQNAKLNTDTNFSSKVIIMHVDSFSCIIVLLKIINETPGHIFTEPDVITTSSPLPVAITIVWLSVFQFDALTSGDFVLSALLRDLVCNGGSADGV